MGHGRARRGSGGEGRARPRGRSRPDPRESPPSWWPRRRKARALGGRCTGSGSGGGGRRPQRWIGGKALAQRPRRPQREIGRLKGRPPPQAQPPVESGLARGALARGALVQPAKAVGAAAVIHSTQPRVCGRRSGADFPCRRREPADLEILGGGGVFLPFTASRLCQGRGANNPRSAVPNPWHIRIPPSSGEACRLAPSTGAAGRLPAPSATALRRTTPPPDGMNSVASSSSYICRRNLLQRRGRGGGPPPWSCVPCRTVKGVRAVSRPQSAATNARASRYVAAAVARRHGHAVKRIPLSPQIGAGVTLGVLPRLDKRAQ